MTSGIGRCEWCGIVDHHLVDGECPACATKTKTLDGYGGAALGAEADVRHAIVYAMPSLRLAVLGHRGRNHRS